MGKFAIQLNDLSGNQLKIGGMPITITLSNEKLKYYIQVNDHNNGIYSGHYTVCTPGTLTLFVEEAFDDLPTR
jgi:hypothetical protein